MTYSQPQQQQAQHRPNRSALWVNDRKNSPSQPDYKGNVEISYALAQELLAAFNAGQYEQDKGGQPCIKLDFGLYVQQGGQSASGKNKPVLSGFLSTVAETQQSRAAKQQAAAQYQQQPQYAPPQQPQYAPQYAPQPPQPEQAPQYQQIPPAPAPMPQQPPQQAYQQPPAPVAPPAPGMAPMPGAIHGMPPMAPAPTPNLPQGF